MITSYPPVRQVGALAEEINEWNDLYCLGYGATYPIALEGALKLRANADDLIVIPKSDDVYFVSAFRLFLVGFGGGWVD